MTDTATTPPGSGRAGSLSASDRRHEVNEELRRASRWAEGLAWFYRAGAVAYAIATMFAIVALARTDVPLRGGLQVVTLTTLLTVLLLMGAMHVLFQPVVWSLVIAALATLVAFIHSVGPNPLGIALPAAITLAATLWAALGPTLRFKQLMDRHRDVYILHHASNATRRSLKDRTPAERHDRLVAAMHRAARRAWGTSVGAACAIAVASSAGTWAVVDAARPEDLESCVASFESAWRETDVEAIGALQDARVRAVGTAWLAGRVASLGWAEDLPPLSEGTRREEEDGLYIDYDADGAPVTARWARSGPRWQLVEVALPEPPLDPTLEAFRAAWAASDAAALAAHFAPEHQQNMRGMIEEAISTRDWTALPPLGEGERRALEDGSQAVDMPAADDALLTRWHLESDSVWRLHYVKFPRR